MSTTAKPVSKSKINKLPENKAKRHIYANANAGNSGGPVVDVKAWKAAQKAAASGKGDEEKSSDRDRDPRATSKGTELAAACDASAKEALAAVNKSDKKGEVVKGFVNHIVASDASKSGTKMKESSGSSSSLSEAGEAKLAAAAPKNFYAEKTPRMLLQEFCSKQKLNRPNLCSMEEKGGGGFKGKFILHSKEKSGEKEIRITKESYATPEEALEWASVMGLFVVAGDRRMDLLLPTAYRGFWKVLEEEDVIRKKELEAAAARSEARQRREAREKREEDDIQKLYMSEDLRRCVEDAIKLLGDIELPPPKCVNQEEASAVSDQLTSMGFSSAYVRRAVSAVGGDLDRALDWLCIHVPENELPRSFAPKEDMPFQVVNFQKPPEPPVQDLASGQKMQQSAVVSASASSDRLEVGAARVLAAMGFPESDAAAALAVADGDGQAALWRLLAGAGGCNEAVLTDAAVEEEEALQAIYADDFSAHDPAPSPVGGCGREWRVRLPAGGWVLHVWPGPTYPLGLPARVAVSRQDAAAAAVSVAVGMWVVRRLHAAAERCVGDAAVHSLVEALSDAVGGEGAAAALTTEVAAAISALTMGTGGDENGDQAADDGGGSGDEDGCSDAPTAGGSWGATPPPSAATSDAGRARVRGAGGGARAGSVAELAAESARLKEAAERRKSDADWRAMQAERARLPAHKERERVVAAVRASPVVVVSGETGCGKTTQARAPLAAGRCCVVVMRRGAGSVVVAFLMVHMKRGGGASEHAACGGLGGRRAGAAVYPRRLRGAGRGRDVPPHLHAAPPQLGRGRGGARGRRAVRGRGRHRRLPHPARGPRVGGDAAVLLHDGGAAAAAARRPGPARRVARRGGRGPARRPARTAPSHPSLSRQPSATPPLHPSVTLVPFVCPLHLPACFSVAPIRFIYPLHPSVSTLVRFLCRWTDPFCLSRFIVSVARIRVNHGDARGRCTSGASTATSSS